MAELKLPNGQTISTNNPGEIAEFMARGAVSQGDALAANPGMTIQEIASRDAQSWNAPGGQGYLDAMAQGHNDPTSDPRNPQAFNQQAIDRYRGGAGMNNASPTIGGLLGGGSGSGGGGLLGGGSPAPQQPMAKIQPTYPPSGQFGGASPPTTLAPQMGDPTLPAFQQPQQSFSDIMSKYDVFRAPLQNGGVDWMSPAVNPGQISVYDANISRRYL